MSWSEIRVSKDCKQVEDSRPVEDPSAVHATLRCGGPASKDPKRTRVQVVDLYRSGEDSLTVHVQGETAKKVAKRGANTVFTIRYNSSGALDVQSERASSSFMDKGLALGALGTGVLTLAGGHYAYDPLANVPGLQNDSLKTLTFSLLWGGRFLTHTGWRHYEPKLSEPVAIALDAVYLTAGATTLVLSLTDSGGDSELAYSMQAFNDVLTARVPRHFGNGPGFWAELGVGAAFLALGTGTLAGGACKVPDLDISPEEARMRREMGLTTTFPDAPRFPGVCMNMIEIGANDIVSAGLHGILHLQNRKRQENIPVVPGLSLLNQGGSPNGFVLSLGGTF